MVSYHRIHPTFILTLTLFAGAYASGIIYEDITFSFSITIFEIILLLIILPRAQNTQGILFILFTVLIGGTLAEKKGPDKRCSNITKMDQVRILFDTTYDMTDGTVIELRQYDEDNCDESKNKDTEIDLLLKDIRSLSTSKRVAKIELLVASLNNTLVNSSCIGYCGAKKKVMYIKSSYPTEYTFVKYWLENRGDIFEEVYKAMIQNSFEKRFTMWSKDDSLSAYSFKRLIIVIIVFLIVMLAIMLIGNRNAQKNIFYIALVMGLIACAAFMF